MTRRAAIMARYRAALPELAFQPLPPGRQAHQFGVGLLPAGFQDERGAFLAALAAAGIGQATYFSPHLAQQSYLAENAVFGDLPVTDDVAGRVVCLPMFDSMTEAEADEVIAVVRRAMSGLMARRGAGWGIAAE
jgi:dTDP-4-amino-4,6-dideoxygalactose transaminase